MSFTNTLLGRLLAQLPSPVIVLAPDGLVTYANQAVQDYFNLPTSPIGQPLEACIAHPDLHHMLAEGQTQGELFLPRPKRALNVEVAYLPDDGALIMMQDISHLRTIERVKNSLVSEISRNLRSPLTAIVGYTELLERIGDLNPQQESFVERIMLSVNAMTRLINDLAELEKIEANVDIRREVVDMRQIVRYTVDGLHERLLERGHHLALDLADQLPSLMGNPVRLRQVVHNLLDNAIRYTPEGGEITLNLHTEDGFIILVVEDNGIGIAPEDQPHVFEKFFRASEAMQLNTSSGLGLAIVENIVQHHQGRIWVDSQPGQGTRFTVMLPIGEQTPSDTIP